MKINCKKELLNLKNEPLPTGDEGNLTVGRALANIVLAPHETKNGFRPLKSYELAKKFYYKDEVEIDNSDLIQLKEIVENGKVYSTLVVAQLLEALNEEK